jgi:3-phenylpropionate/cinnamic acid dioxygenase small subunit
MTASENFRTLNRRELRLDVEELYAAYVACLDEERFEEWPEFFTDDAIYRIIPRENFERGLPIATLHCESKGYLQDRVVAIRQTRVFSVGQCHDMLVDVGGSLKFKEKLVIFDSELIPNSLIYPL